MITNSKVFRRKIRSNSHHTPPIRFYKIVAISFLALTLILLGVVMFMSAKRASITIITKPDPIDITERLAIGNVSDPMITAVVTTTFVTRTEKFMPTGSKTEDGTARGIVTIYNDSSSDQPLVATTRLLSKENVLFRLENRVVVPARGSIEAEVYADVVGPTGDIDASQFTIPGLLPQRQKEVYAKSKTAMTGGRTTIGVLSREDLEAAQEKLLASLKKTGMEEIQEKTSEFYEGEFSIVQNTFDTNVEIGQEVGEYSITGKATILGVLYDARELRDWAVSMLAQKDVSSLEHIEPSTDAPTVNIMEYDIAKSTANLDVYFSGIATLNPNAEALDKMNFFGKTTDEIRRYLLAIDHVYRVDVVFRPAWVRSVPHVADHIDVTIKRTE